MSKPWSVIFFLCFLLLSLGSQACVGTGTSMAAHQGPDVLQRRVQTWLGLPREFLEKHWGIAQDTKDMGLGLRYLEYKAVVQSKRSKVKLDKKSLAKSICKVVFTIDITGTVRGGQWSGDRSSCLNFVREVPSMAPKQTLVSF